MTLYPSCLEAQATPLMINLKENVCRDRDLDKEKPWALEHV